MSNKVDSLTTKVKEVANEELHNAQDLAYSALRSGAYLYPIKGVVYFLTNRSLWKPLFSKIIPMMALSLGVIVAMFFFTFLPQLAILVFVNGPLAALTTTLLTLSESSILISILSRTFLLQDALVDTFDGVLVSRKQTGVLLDGRELKSGNFNDPVAKLGKLVKSPFEKFTPNTLIRYIMYLPLNFIPVIGTVLFLLAQGRSRGNEVHNRYFQLKNWDNSRIDEWLKDNSPPYTAFGTVATLLELIPFANILFSFTNTVGAALWAADIESNDIKMTEVKSRQSAESTLKAE